MYSNKASFERAAEDARTWLDSDMGGLHTIHGTDYHQCLRSEDLN
jgi:hypothetical protein